MPILASSNFVNAYGKASVVTAGALPLESMTETASDAFVVKYNTDGKAQWSARIASTGADIGYGITTDSSGNVYVTGQGGSNIVVTAFNSDGTAFGNISNAGSTDAFVVKYNSNGIVQWIARVGLNGADIGYAIATDSSGNVYVTGQGGNSVVTAYNSNGTAFATTLSNVGNGDAFVVKYNSSGFVQWVAKIASTQVDIGYAIATDSSGNVYVTGNGGTNSVVTAYNSDATAFGTTIANSGGNDAFIVKYNTNGFVQWATRIATSGNEVGFAITTDSSGNVYVTGQGGAGAVNVTSFNSDGTAFATTLSNVGLGDAFVVKYNTTGFVQWAAKIASTQADIGYGIATDSSGNVYVTGRGGSSTVSAFNSDGTAFATTLANAGGGDAFIVKYNSSGFVQWVARVASTGVDGGQGISVDSGGNVYVTGYCGDDLNPTAYNSNGTVFGTITARGQGDGFLVKYDTNGFVQWFTRFGSVNDDTVQSVTVDANGNVYITGEFTSSPFSIYGSSLSLFSTLPNSGGTDAFVVKYSTTGDPQWTARIASTAADVGYSIVTDASGNVYVTGEYNLTLTIFNSDGTAFATTTANAGSAAPDAFIVKYNANGFVQWAARVASTLGEIGYGITTDSSGNVYVTGRGGNNAVVTAYNSDATAFGTTIANLGGTDAFIVKYNTNGFVQWVTRIASTGNELGFGIATDSSGNVYVTGQGGNAVVTVYNSDLSAFSPTLANAGGGDAFIVKYNTNGFVQWAAKIASTQADIGYAIATDSSGNVYVTGQGGNAVVTAYNSDGTAFGTTLANLGGGDAFLVKYDTNGFVQWVARMATTGSDVGYGIATDASGNVYVTGLSGVSGSLSMSLYNSDATEFGTRLGNSGTNDAFIVKYNTNGFVQWATKIGSSSGDSGYGIAVDSNGNVYVACEAGTPSAISIFNSDTTIFAVANLSLGIVKYNKDGFAQWFQQISGNTLPISGNKGISTDATGNVYLTGATPSGQVTRIYGGGNSGLFKVLSSENREAVFVAKHSSNGNIVWLAQIDSNGTDIGYSIASDSSGNIYVTGNGAAGAILTAYNSNGTSFATKLPNSGLEDAFVVKYNTNGFVQWAAKIASTIAEIGYGITTDSSGDVYVTGGGGGVAGVITAFNSDGTAFATTLSGSGGGDVFIAKYNTSGFVQWVARLAGTGIDIGRGISTDSSGNVYVTGQFAGTTFTAFSSNGVAFGTTISNGGAGDVFIVKYNTNGSVQWIARAAGSTADIGYGISTDSSGNVYITGSYGTGGIRPFNSDGTQFGTIAANIGGGDAFIVKYNTNGFVQWISRIGSTGVDIGHAIATDSAGNVYVTGQGGSAAVVTAYNSDTTAFSPTLAHAGNGDAFIVKYNTNGFVQWVTRVASGSADIGYGILTDSAGDVYLTGKCGAFSVINAYNADATSTLAFIARSLSSDTTFVVKYSSSGVAQWISLSSGSIGKEARGIAIDGSNNIYTTGSMRGSYFLAYDA
jgi:hypothetical protein